MNGVTLEQLALVFGATYRYCQGGSYRPLFIALHAHSGQDLIVYEGLDGPDRGLHFACTFFDWQLRFTRCADLVPAPATPPRKVAGFYSAGTGV